MSEFGRILIQDGSSLTRSRTHCDETTIRAEFHQAESRTAVELHVTMRVFSMNRSRTVTLDAVLTAAERPHLPCPADAVQGTWLLADRVLLRPQVRRQRRSNRLRSNEGIYVDRVLQRYSVPYIRWCAMPRTILVALD